MDTQVDIFRRLVRTVTCPRCRAPGDQYCRDEYDEPRKANHQARIDAWSKISGQEVQYAWKKRMRAGRKSYRSGIADL